MPDEYRRMLQVRNDGTYGSRLLQPRSHYQCGSLDHVKVDCPQVRNGTTGGFGGSHGGRGGEKKVEPAREKVRAFHMTADEVVETLDVVTDAKKEKKGVEDMPIVNEYPEMFAEDLTSLPPDRQVEFRIDLMPGATPIA
ncbi:hypothetical protein L6452_19734 [Arctium lappa]|uniref:Uncharacterized protein n=1 Tax=Arctium lappa TaxID=4217 RepID=A0ACB9B8Z1_ARCLA|nr:hypothetical protein L6452_19734 [Arctium lappa]